MVSNVSFSGKYGLGTYDIGMGLNSKDIDNVAKYVLGRELVVKQENPFDGMGLMVGITGLEQAWKIKNWVKYNKGTEGLLASEWAKVKDSYRFQKDVFGQKGYSIDALREIHSNSKTAEKTFESTIAQRKLEYYQKAFENKQYGLWNRIKSMFSGKSVEECAAEKVTGLRSEAAKLAEESTKLAKGVEASGEAVSFGTKALKCVKGNGLFAAIEGGLQLFTQVIPSFATLGAEKGFKQLGKSIVKTAASVGGWAVGAEIGAAIGSVIPGAGTVVGGAVGAIIGVVAGTLGSWAANKLATKVVGKDELEIAKEEKSEKLKAEAIKDPQAVQQLLAAAYQKIQEDPNSEDAKIAAKSINKLAESIQTNDNENNVQTAQNVNSGNNPYDMSSFIASKFNQSNTDIMDKDIMSMNLGIA